MLYKELTKIIILDSWTPGLLVKNIIYFKEFERGGDFFNKTLCKQKNMEIFSKDF